MTTREVPKVRLVKCPKCRRLLPESQELPVYECGGCRTLLQAKIRKNEANDTKMVLPETSIIPSKELINTVEEKGSSSSSQNGFPKDQFEAVKLPREVSSSTDVTDGDGVDSSNIQVPTVAADEKMNHSQEIIVPGFNSVVISTVTSETTEQMNLDSDLSSVLDDMPAPTTRSVSSSYESETINQVLSTPVEVQTSFADAEFTGVHERLMRERGKFPMNAEAQDQSRSSFSSDNPDFIMQYNQSITVPFYLKNESPSCHWHEHDEFLGTSSICSPDDPLNYSQEKIRLLRMVYKLQDKLDKTYVSGEQNVPTRGAYYNHEAFQEERYNGSGPFGHSRYDRRYREGEEWFHQSRSTQMPFSGETINRERFQADHQYPHCHCYMEPGRINHTHNCYGGAQCSRPPVHQPWTDSIIPSQDPYSKSDELGYIADERRKFYSGEKIQKAKKHYRPVAGGAPFVSCYQCLKPLQLPADFLLFKRCRNKLRCGACTTVLFFSLENNNQIHPFVPGEVEHRQMPNGNSLAPGEKRKKSSFFKKSSVNRYKNPVNSEVEAEPSTSKGLGMKKQALRNGEPERKIRTGSPLHRLMGYTSASELLRSGSS